MRLRITNPDLTEERAKCNFDREEAFKVIISAEVRDELNKFSALVKKHPELKPSAKFYDMTREEKMRDWWERLRVIMADEEFRHLITANSYKKCKFYSWQYEFAGTNPMALHMQMFTMSVA